LPKLTSPNGIDLANDGSGARAFRILCKASQSLHIGATGSNSLKIEKIWIFDSFMQLLELAQAVGQVLIFGFGGCFIQAV